MSKVTIPVKVKETAAGTFYFIEVGSEAHGRISARLWVSARLVEDRGKEKAITFPAPARIERTPRGTIILKPSHDHLTYYVLVPCGYRGSSTVEVIEPTPVESIPFNIYRSPIGSLGISRGVLVVVPAGPVRYRWTRSGRLYGSASRGITTLYPDGSSETIEGVYDLGELTELKEHLEAQ